MSEFRIQNGLTIFLTGLSGAGKTTIANALSTKISNLTMRPVTVLDGDIVRENISKGLSFSKGDRELNVQRVGFVASEITRHGGIVICAMIAPYSSSRQIVREMVCKNGHYLEVYVSTPLRICEQRDPKGLYAKARNGFIKNFTGIDDPYEVPLNPEIIVDTNVYTVEQIVDKIIVYISNKKFF